MGNIIMKKLKLSNGEELSYRESVNKGEEARTILLIHGNLVSSRHWGYFLNLLSDYYKVIAVDLRGAGSSTYNNPISSFRDWSNDLKLFCDELSLKDFLLMGWSMGGGISQQFVCDNPTYASKLLLFESVPCTGYPYHKKDVNGEFLPEFYDNREELLEDKVQLKPMIDALERNNRSFMKYLWDQLVFNIVKPEENEYQELLDDIYMTRNLRDAAWAAQTFNISHISNGVTEGTGEVDKIEIPVLIMAGDSDLIVPSSLGEFTGAQIGDNARVQVLKGCGHAPHYDNPQIVVDKILEFYKPQ